MKMRRERGREGCAPEALVGLLGAGLEVLELKVLKGSAGGVQLGKLSLGNGLAVETCEREQKRSHNHRQSQNRSINSPEKKHGHSPTFELSSSKLNFPVTTPMDPVSVRGSATILSQAMDM